MQTLRKRRIEKYELEADSEKKPYSRAILLEGVKTQNGLILILYSQKDNFPKVLNCTEAIKPKRD